MDGSWMPGALALVLLLARGCYTSSEGSWCYDKPECGPGTWLTQEYCNGKRQSPINIRSEKAIHNRSLGAITLTGYDDGKKLQEMINSGKTVDIELEDGLYFTGHGLPAQYAAKSFHFHWGDGDSRPGSEHYIDNRQYPMELHIVHTKNNTSVSDARKDPEGIAVLGFFLEGSEMASGKTAEAWESFIKNLKKVSEKGKHTDLDSTFSLLDLLGPTDFARYFRYPGSLTTPQCNEVVIWTIFPDPILVPPKVVEAFPSELRYTDSSSGPRMQNNFRPLQPIGKREVQASAALKAKRSAASLVAPSTPLLPFLFIATIISSMLV
ncbi:carbonic anhydrase 4-like [Varanus komodoensis]|uniref:carbonic anhydrase 4-like n=1 Tax=Varanus komodoensis TaxID=61221 RepID=UPI001CF7CCCA|nr:carbonic anhydrase 4-like [Varanus komodoensis]